MLAGNAMMQTVKARWRGSGEAGHPTPAAAPAPVRNLLKRQNVAIRLPVVPSTVHANFFYPSFHFYEN